MTYLSPCTTIKGIENRCPDRFPGRDNGKGATAMEIKKEYRRWMDQKLEDEALTK